MVLMVALAVCHSSESSERLHLTPALPYVPLMKTVATHIVQAG